MCVQRIKCAIQMTLLVLCYGNEIYETGLPMIECKVNHCENDGICYIDLNDPMKKQYCACKPEHIGEKCNYLNPCIPGYEICQNNGTCVPKFVDNKYIFTCECPAGYTGSACENRQWPKCQSDTCNGGTCSYNGTEIYCECPYNRAGKRCEYINYCADRPCQNGGTCIVRESDYFCLCAPGWTGSTCSEDINECALGYTCLNGGTCINLGGSFRCVCPERWRGDNQCSKVTDPCMPDPCQNQGYCSIDDYNLAVCICRNGYSGKFCETRAPGCTHCENGGECVFQNDKFTCKCSNGFTGYNCERRVDICENDNATICQNGGTYMFNVSNIFQKLGNALCSCPEYYTGNYCETRVDVCLTDMNLCSNDATCINTKDGYECHCPPYKIGNYCEFSNYCIQNPCFHNGTCVEGEPFLCLCPPGLSGSLCEEDINECSNSPCLNNGTCSNTLGSFYCQCTGGWSGQVCEEKLKESDSVKPCQNKTFCALHRDDGICDDECNVEGCGYDGTDCNRFLPIISLAIDFSIGVDEFIANKNIYLKMLEEATHIRLEIKRNERDEELIIDCSKEVEGKCVRVILSLEPNCNPRFLQFCLNSTSSVMQYFNVLEKTKALPLGVKNVQSYVHGPKKAINGVLREKILIIVVVALGILLFIIIFGVILRNHTWIQTTRKLPKFFEACRNELLKSTHPNNAEKLLEESKPLNITVTPCSSPITSIPSADDGDVNAKGPTGFTALMAIIIQKDLSDDDRDNKIKELAKRGADLTLRRDRSGETVLHLAVRYNRISTCRTLVALCPQLVRMTDSHERTPLHAAACIDSVIITQILMRSCQVDIDAVDENGYTALQLAVELELNDVSQELLHLGANPDFIHPRAGVSALHCAARTDNADAITLLLNHRAKIDITNEKGETPLHFAAREGNNRSCALLLKFGAAPDVVNALGESAFSYAMSQGNNSLISMLQRAMIMRPNPPLCDINKGKSRKRKSITDSYQEYLNSIANCKEPLAIVPAQYVNASNIQNANQVQVPHMWNYPPSNHPRFPTAYFPFPFNTYAQYPILPNVTPCTVAENNQPSAPSQDGRTPHPTPSRIMFI